MGEAIAPLATLLRSILVILQLEGLTPCITVGLITLLDAKSLVVIVLSMLSLCIMSAEFYKYKRLQPLWLSFKNFAPVTVIQM